MRCCLAVAMAFIVTKLCGAVRTEGEETFEQHELLHYV